MALDGCVRHEEVDVRVVLQGGARPSAVVVDELAEEREGVALPQAGEANGVGELHFERRTFVVQLLDGVVQIRFEELQHARRPTASPAVPCGGAADAPRRRVAVPRPAMPSYTRTMYRSMS